MTSLLSEGETYDGWFLANRLKNRFYVLNADVMFERLVIEHTRGEPFFEEAKRIIREETEWPNQFGFGYSSSHTQIFPDKRWAPKLFGHAATIVVALELIAAERKPGFNVYDYVRIIPAFYFVDGLDDERLDSLVKHYETTEAAAGLPPAGKGDTDSAFERACRVAIGQPNSRRLLRQMANGYTVTKFVADAVMAFIAANFPIELHVGPVCSAGQEARSEGLGTDNAAPALRVPKQRDAVDLAPCY